MERFDWVKRCTRCVHVDRDEEIGDFTCSWAEMPCTHLTNCPEDNEIEEDWEDDEEMEET